MTRMPKVLTRWRLVCDSSVGEYGLPTACALARDLQNVYGVKRPHVTDRMIAFTDPITTERIKFKTPEKLATWLHAYDKGSNPDPLAIVLHKKDATVTMPDPNQVPKKEKRIRLDIKSKPVRKRISSNTVKIN